MKLKQPISRSRPAGKVHTTVRVRRDVLNDFNERAASLNMRRDSYLNRMLDFASHELRRVHTGQPGASRVDSHLRRSNAGMAKLGLVLDSDVARRITAICKEKNVSRDAFVERSIELLVGMGPVMGSSPLGAAADILQDPFGWLIQASGSSDRFYSDLSLDLSDLLPTSTRRKPQRK
jgi:hypothetical protein